MSENNFQVSNLETEASAFDTKIQTKYPSITLNTKSNTLITNLKILVSFIIMKFDKILTKPLT